MDQKTLLKQMLEFNRNSFNNTYDTMTMLQEQAEKMASTLINHPNLLPDEGKQIIKDWVKMFKQQREHYKDKVNTNFETLEKFFE